MHGYIKTIKMQDSRSPQDDETSPIWWWLPRLWFVWWKMFVGQYDRLEDVCWSIWLVGRCRHEVASVPIARHFKSQPTSCVISIISNIINIIISIIDNGTTQKSFLRWVWQDFFFFIHQSFWEFEITADVQNSIANQFSLQKDFSLETCFPRLCTIKRIKRAYCRAPEIETKYNLWALKIILYLLHVWL